MGTSETGSLFVIYNSYFMKNQDWANYQTYTCFKDVIEPIYLMLNATGKVNISCEVVSDIFAASLMGKEVARNYMFGN